MGLVKINNKFNKKGAWIIREIESKKVIEKFRTKPAAISFFQNNHKDFYKPLEVVCDLSKMKHNAKINTKHKVFRLKEDEEK